MKETFCTVPVAI